MMDVNFLLETEQDYHPFCGPLILSTRHLELLEQLMQLEPPRPSASMRSYFEGKATEIHTVYLY